MTAASASPLRSSLAALALLCTAQFVVVLDVSVVNVALPAIGDDLGFSEAQLSWVINAYTLIFGGCLLLGGRAGDLFGRRRVFLTGLTLFTGASVACGVAWSETSLIIARAVQGLGAAMLSPAALALLLATYRAKAQRNRAVAAWGAVAGAAGAFGSVVGGLLTDVASWHWCFLINLPIGIVLLALLPRAVEESRDEHAKRLDLPGAVLATSGLLALVYGIVQAEEHGFGSGQTLAFIALAILLLAAFVAVERRSPEPLVRLSIFRMRSLSVANGVHLLANVGLFGPLLLISLYQQQVLGFDALQAGAGLLPLAVGVIATASIVPRLVERFGVKPILTVGLVVLVAGLLAFATLRADGSYLADVVPASLVCAGGLGLVMVPLTIAATANVAPEDSGLASGLFNTAQEVGGALGVALLLTVAASSTADQLAAGSAMADALVDGYRVAFLIGAALVAAATVAAAVLLRSRDLPREMPEGAAAH
jgi:EmrB/QacA subfamily drug resistance transporter